MVAGTRPPHFLCGGRSSSDRSCASVRPRSSHGRLPWRVAPATWPMLGRIGQFKGGGSAPASVIVSRRRADHDLEGRG